MPGSDDDSETGFRGYRRRVEITPSAGRVIVEMEDDCHRFGITILHDGTRVTEVQSRSPRHPWTTCPAAGDFLATRMKGVTLEEAPHVENQRQHCTHLYDLFIMGVAHAGEDQALTYDIRVADPVDGMRMARVSRNGAPLLAWRLDGNALDGAPGGNFHALEIWSRTLLHDQQEAARMLRRGAMVSRGRAIDFPVGGSASSVGLDRAVCYSFQPERGDLAFRVPDTLRDFAAHPELLLGDSERAPRPKVIIIKDVSAVPPV